MDEKKVLKILSITEYDLIGSSIDNNIKYKSDVDAQEFINLNNNDIETYNKILLHFQNIFKSFEDNNNIYIIDFKCGVLSGNYPIRWNKQNIKDGFIIIEDIKINFIDCLQEQSIIKIDIIAIEKDNLFHDITYNYYFKFKKFDTNPRNMSFDEITNSLILDVKNYRNEGKYYKSLKRLYSLYKLSNVNEIKKGLLLSIINSKIGKLNKLANHLSLIVEVINNKFKNPNINDINYNIQYVYNNIDNDYLFLFKNLNKRNKTIIDNNLINELNILINKLNIIINNIFNLN